MCSARVLAALGLLILPHFLPSHRSSYADPLYRSSVVVRAQRRESPQNSEAAHTEKKEIYECFVSVACGLVRWWCTFAPMYVLAGSELRESQCLSAPLCCLYSRIYLRRFLDLFCTNETAHLRHHPIPTCDHLLNSSNYFRGKGVIQSEISSVNSAYPGSLIY